MLQLLMTVMLPRKYNAIDLADAAGGRKARPYEVKADIQAVAHSSGVGAGFISARMANGTPETNKIDLTHQASGDSRNPDLM